MNQDRCKRIRTRKTRIRLQFMNLPALKIPSSNAANMCKEQPAIHNEAGTPRPPSGSKDMSDRESKIIDMNLLQASESGEVEVATNLLGQGANVNGTDATGKTPLHIAASAGHTTLSEALLGAGADTKARDNLDKTPLHHAASRSNVDIAKQLVAAGCDIQARDKWGKTALHLVADYKSGAGGESPQRALAIMSMLLEAGANPDVLDKQGKTALHLTAQRGHLEFTSLLVNSRADVHIHDTEGKTALHHAAKCSEPGGVRVLVEKGAKAEAQDKLGKTALHGASRSATLTLLDNCADPEAADMHGRTALHDAAMANTIDVAGALISAGAKVNAKDKKKATPLDMAMRNGKDTARKGELGGRTMQSLLRSHGGVPGKSVGLLACFAMF